MCNLLRHAPSNYVSMGCTNYTLSKEQGPTISDGMSLIVFRPTFLFLPTTGVLVSGRSDRPPGRLDGFTVENVGNCRCSNWSALQIDKVAAELQQKHDIFTCNLRR